MHINRSLVLVFIICAAFIGFILPIEKILAAELVDKSNFKIGVIEGTSQASQVLTPILKEKGYSSADFLPLEPKIFTEQSKYNGYHYMIIMNYPVFTAEEYQGMKDYVMSGGILILTGVSTKFLDVNRTGILADAKYVGSGISEIIGTEGYGAADSTKFKIDIPTPLTKGMPTGEWIEGLRYPYWERLKVISAMKIGLWEFNWTRDTDKQLVTVEYPVIILKRAGKGVCVWLAFGGNIDNQTNSGYGVKVLLNVLTPESYEWLLKRKPILNREEK